MFHTVSPGHPPAWDLLQTDSSISQATALFAVALKTQIKGFLGLPVELLCYTARTIENSS